jgi:hypothetical protein
MNRERVNPVPEETDEAIAAPVNVAYAFPFCLEFGPVCGRGFTAQHLYPNDFGDGTRSNDKMESTFSEVDPDETFRL